MSDTPTLAVASASFLVAAAQWLTNHFKGKKRDDGNFTILRRIEGKVDVISKKTNNLELDTLEEFAKHSERINEVKHLVIGADGENGVRGRVKRLEDDVGVLETSFASLRQAHQQ